MNLKWRNCIGSVWCRLNQVDLNHEHFNDMEGVYIIWHGGETPWVVYVGQGEIRQRLKDHREDPRVQKYEYKGLYVTWARVEKSYRNGVEAYLSRHWKPLEGSRHPDVNPIVVNSPWED